MHLPIAGDERPDCLRSNSPKSLPHAPKERTLPRSLLLPMMRRLREPFGKIGLSAR